MKKNLLLGSAVSLLFVVLALGIISLCKFLPYKNVPVTLELGMFAGSNWDIANGDSYRIIDRTILEFEQKNPGVRVHYYSGIRRQDYDEWLSEQVLQGKTPDVFFVRPNQFERLVSLGILKNLDSIISEDSQIRGWEYFTPAWNAGTYHGKQYAIPYQADFTLMAVNMTLLKMHGQQMPERNWTWDDFYSLCKSMTLDVDGDSVLDIAGTCNYTWKEAVYANGVRLFDDNGKRIYFSDPKTVEAVQFMQKLSALTKDKMFTSADFDAGRVVFMPMSFAKFCTYISYPYKVYKDLNYEWGCLSMPAGYSGNNTSEVNTLLVGMNAHTKHEKLAFEFLKMLVHDLSVQTDVYRSGQGASALRLVAASDTAKNMIDNYTHSGEYRLNLVAEILNCGLQPPRFEQYAETMIIADNAINNIIRDKKDADNSLKMLQRNIQNQLAK